MLSKLVLLLLAVSLNILHIFIPARVINYNFDPVLGLLSFLVFLAIVYFTSSLKSDYFFFVLLGISFVSQVYSYFLNGGGVPDYIDLYLFNSNIPDFVITLTILTWWYKRVYKHHKLTPAEIGTDV